MGLCEGGVVSKSTETAFLGKGGKDRRLPGVPHGDVMVGSHGG